MQQKILESARTDWLNDSIAKLNAEGWRIVDGSVKCHSLKRKATGHFTKEGEIDWQHLWTCVMELP